VKRARRITDPTGDAAYSAAFLKLLDGMLKNMPVWEGQALRQHLGLDVSTPDQAWLATYSDEQREDLISRGMSRLLHPSRVLEVARLMDADSFIRLGGRHRSAQTTRCERHGADVVAGGCSECPCPTGVDRHSRFLDYCSTACKQAAYRRRKKAS
jgi:hypothetical protein